MDGIGRIKILMDIANNCSFILSLNKLLDKVLLKEEGGLKLNENSHSWNRICRTF